MKNKIRVLMIDDNTSLVNMLKEYFEDNEKIELVLSCSDGEEGLKTILEKEKEYDIILLDLVMPKKDGIYVLEELNKRNISKNIIVETSYNAPDTIRKASEYGVNYYILKPYDLCDIEQRILDVFEVVNNKV